MRLEFVHIPKTGGKSIKKSFPECKWYSKHSDKKEVARKIPGYFDNSPCNFWHNHELVPQLYHKNRKKFCVIRDPVDRIVSEYRWRGLPDDVSVFNDTLQRWSREVLQNPFMLDNHLAPQHLFARQCDHVITMDADFEKNVNRLVRQYGIAPRRLLHIASQPYQFVNRQSLSTKNLEWVQTYYAKDFQLFQTFEKSFDKTGQGKVLRT